MAAESRSVKVFGASKSLSVISLTDILIFCSFSIVVVALETSRTTAENNSLSSSEVIMPQPVTAESLAAANASPSLVQQDSDTRDVATPQTSVPSMTTVSTSSDDEDGSTSLLDEFETVSDLEYYEASRSLTHPDGPDGDVEYVVLYDDESDDD